MATDNDKHDAVPGDESKRSLRSWCFFGIAAVQFLTSLNDNTYRWLIVPIGYTIYGTEHKGLILTFGLAFFVVPYLLLVAPAGYLADRFSKRSVIAATMLLQAAVLVLGMIAISLTSPAFLFLTLFFMGAQGALLSPSKGGVIPETLLDERISAANGVIGMATVMAAVVGSVLGNMLYAWTALWEKPVGGSPR